jgi:CheY-like chemotaxis protein
MTRKILLADDSVTIQKVVELTFSDGAYQVQCVSNGRAAVQKIQEDQPDILLCDVIMPEMNGYDVAAFVKKNPSYSSIPVILLTGTFEPFDEEKARQSGADSYITKPFDSKMLVDKVEELLKKRVAFDASANEAVQVFHSRTEFMMGGAGAPELPPLEPQPAAGTPAAIPGFLGGPQELEPPVGEEPFVRATDSDEANQTVRMQALDLQEAFPAAEPTIEALSAPMASGPAVVDLGPALDEPIPETAFAGIVEPETPVAPRPHDEVVLGPEGQEEWPVEAGDVQSIPAAPESVSGAEDWGPGQSIAVPSEAVLDLPEEIEIAPPAEQLPPFVETAEEPQIVHELTDQQSMVATAHQDLVPLPVESVMEPVTPAPPPEPITGAYEVPLGEEPTHEIFGAATDEMPFEPEGGLEETLPPASPVAEAPAVMESTGSFPTPTEQGLDAASMFVAPAPETPAVPVVAEVPPQAPAPVPVLDRAEVEGHVRRAAEEMIPAIVAAAVPATVAAQVLEALPGLARQYTAEALPAVVGPLLSQAVPEAVQQALPGALREALPGHLQQVAQELAPGIIAESVRTLAAAEIERVVKEMAPEIVRQVAWEVIPELAESIIRRRIQELESEPG